MFTNFEKLASWRERLSSDIFVNENENENENYCAFVHENENENFLKNENRIRTKINLSERIEINY
jgi:hypothetical protein